MSELDEMIEMNKDYRELWSRTGVVSIEGWKRIHLEHEYFLEKFDNYEKVTKDSEQYPIELQAKYDEYLFFALVPHNYVGKIE